MFNFNEEELKILDFWKKESIFRKSLDQTADCESFVFYEGPPTANGRPGIHHLLARAFKDIIPRYKTMQGYHVVRKGGWDTHGLPVELEVEKKLGVNSKPEIENIVEGDAFASIVKFNKECKKSVWTYLNEFQELTERYAYWIDMKDPYITYENNYIESLWWVIAQFNERGFLKKDFRVAPYCFRCGTTLSSHELALGYQTVKDISVYAKFTVLEGEFKGAHILAWTTTPWTLPGNVGLAVHEDLDYVLVSYKDAESGEEQVILAKERLGIIESEYNVIEEFTGRELIGLKYRQLFDVTELQNDASHKVYAADFVTATDGTGVVHTAVMYGADDYELGSAVGLPKVHTVNLEGKFEDFVPGLAGMPAKELDTDIAILKYLSAEGLLFKKEKYEHEYPFCWRCKNPVLYYALESFVVEMSRLRDDMLTANEKITWLPKHIKEGRFGEWLREVKDWNFSRSRYWGTPLPIWINEDTGEMKVVQSYNELRELADNFDEVYPDPEKFDPHRPYIDKITLDGGSMKRVPYVADVWFDSGAMPFAQYHYPHNEKNRAVIDEGKQFPANFICEGMDQTRGWFYTLHAIAAVLDKAPSYTACISTGLVLDENGKKMSKSLGNIVDPWDQIEKYGADSVRWFFYAVNAPGDEKLYSEVELRARQQRFLSTWHNTLQFLLLNGGDDITINYDLIFAPADLDDLDRWIISMFHDMLKTVTESLDAFEIPRAARSIEHFVDELSNWWVRRSRDAFKDEAIAVQKKTVLATILAELATVAAPFVPFMSEYVYQELKSVTNAELAKDSVHLEKYPQFNQSHIDEDLINEMNKVREFASETLKLRAQASIKVRQPLQSLTVPEEIRNTLKKLLAEEVNVKEIHTGKELVLNTKLTEELKAEGDSRDIIRVIQQLRKKNGLQPDDNGSIVISGEHVESLIHTYQRKIETATKTSIAYYKEKKLEGAESATLHAGTAHIRLLD